MRKLFIPAVLALAMGIGVAQAQVVVTVRPPRARSEHRSVRPSRNHVWQPGYNRWDGRAYAWQPGRWEVAPRPRAVWVAPRWVHRGHGWVFVEGHWR
jgi:hypothetical protein